MTNEEAIRLIKIVRDCGSYGNSSDFKFTDAFNYAIVAIDRQIPKKPIIKIEDYRGTDEPFCPCCGEWIGWAGFEEKHCTECGQAIDWSDSDE